MIENLSPQHEAIIEIVQFEGESFFKISNHDLMRHFFMSIVSDSNHWMFISSNGGISAGRKNAEFALFPYYTDDKITETADITGSKILMHIHQKNGQVHFWEPFSDRYEGKYYLSRNLYKNLYGNKILFEEQNHDLGLTYYYQWSSSDVFGFVKTSKLINTAKDIVEISLMDGIQNIVPYGVASNTQNNYSNLVDAYKRSELEKETGLGIYALSAIITDKAEPSEALKANIAWSVGLENPKYALSSLQLKNFRKGIPMQEELDIKAEKGAYFIHDRFELSSGAEKEWMIIADVNKNHAAIVKISDQIKKQQGLAALVKQDVEQGTKNLVRLNAASDGLQRTADSLGDARHFSNTLFNIMRGGIFDHNYQIEKSDFSQYLAKGNKAVFEAHHFILDTMPDVFPLSELRTWAFKSSDPHFRRLCFEYMPLKFSRRHGDPSRPWNRFSINTKSDVDGSKILDYEGNWRDIFQNWEALAYSYPGFVENMIHKFLNATTFDGYNPYRVMKDGFDWETIEPDDPWSYIGYWGDHQIIYLLKLLEVSEKYYPGHLYSHFVQDHFVYANVPYQIKSYQDILKNPKDTVEFNGELDEKIRRKKQDIGADGALLSNQKGAIHQVNFMEKILATTLAKLSNFIPGGGIWMNTQRPEWNDANNALVGNGVSMVTLYYFRRFLHFLNELLKTAEPLEFEISKELKTFFDQVSGILNQNRHLLNQEIDGKAAKLVLDGLGQAGSDYRHVIYNSAFSGNKEKLYHQQLKAFVELSIQHLEHSIKANKRQDNLFHAYNLLTLNESNEISLSYLSEMLEGQVAVLSSGFLASTEVLTLLDNLRNSRLFREDQSSYLLYPNKDLPGFSAKNIISEPLVLQSSLLTRLVHDGNTKIIERDIQGQYHFNGDFRNANDLNHALDSLMEGPYAAMVVADKKLILDIYEMVFDHKSFTGRSGTFFGYEGLGSIYWHMVSKLRLAVQECCLQAIKSKESRTVIDQLVEHYYEINAGLGVHKPPRLYGAFPTDPYSHTPAGKGAQQPGMTGQVKEDIISRFGELGIVVEAGKLQFNPYLLRKEAFVSQACTFEYIDVGQNRQQLPLEAGAIAFTYCQVPVIYSISDREEMHLLFHENQTKAIESLILDVETSRQVFERTGAVVQIMVQINADRLR